MADLLKDQQVKTEGDVEKLPLPESRFLAQAEYNPKTYQMSIWFKSGSMHTFMFVMPQVWDLFKQAPSKGEYFAKAIKGRFQSIRTVSKTVGKRPSTKIH